MDAVDPAWVPAVTCTRPCRLLLHIESHARRIPVEFDRLMAVPPTATPSFGRGKPPSHPSRALNLAPRVPSLSCGSQQNILNYSIAAAQFTKRRSRTLFTNPNIKNVESVFEPPALISGRGMPVTGILPTTIPTFTNK